MPIICKFSQIDFRLGLIDERRNLATLPIFKDQSLKVFFRKYDEYLKDNIPFREFFLTCYLYFSENLLNSFEKENVSGKKGEKYPNFNIAPCIEENLGIIPYSKQRAEWLRLSEAGKYAFFYSKKIPYLLFTVPDKTTLYPELLPFYTDWISHHGWYNEIIDSLYHANIPFYDLKIVLDRYKTKYRLYDYAFDIVHWNGNALMTIYPEMDEILHQNTSNIFNHIKKERDYSSYTKNVHASVYGKEITTFVKLNNMNHITCGPLPRNLQGRTINYERLCVNNNKNNGTLWFFSDSYFGQTHGSNAVTPFVHASHNYIHSHYVLNSSYIFTKVAEERINAGLKPDAVIEEFVERTGGTFNAINDPLLRVMGDFWLHTGGYLLDSSLNENKNISYSNVQILNNETIFIDDFKKNAKNNFIINALDNDPIIVFKNPVTADYLGRAVVMVKYIAPSDSIAQLFYKTKSSPYFSEDKSVKQKIHAGENIVHLTAHVKPFESVYLRFDPGTVSGQYIFENIPEIEDLRKRMQENGL